MSKQRLFAALDALTLEEPQLTAAKHLRHDIECALVRLDGGRGDNGRGDNGRGDNGRDADEEDSFTFRLRLLKVPSSEFSRETLQSALRKNKFDLATVMILQTDKLSNKTATDAMVYIMDSRSLSVWLSNGRQNNVCGKPICF